MPADVAQCHERFGAVVVVLFGVESRLDVREAVSPAELDSFLHSDDVLLPISIELIRQLSPDALAIMDFRNEADIGIAKALIRFPVVGATIEGRWKLELSREFDMTNDSDLFTSRQGSGNLPLYEGKMFHQFDAKSGIACALGEAIQILQRGPNQHLARFCGARHLADFLIEVEEKAMCQLAYLLEAVFGVAALVFAVGQAAGQ